MESPQLAHERWRHTIEEVMQAMFSVAPLLGYMTRPCSVERASEYSEVEGSPVEC
jgi:hypothetical protein